MAIANEKYKNLQEYLNNEMTPEQEAAFEKELATDTELKESYRFEIRVREYLDLAELKKTIPGFSVKDLTREAVVIAPFSTVDTTNAATKTSGRSKTWILYVAAVIMVIIGSVLWVNYNNAPSALVAKNNANTTDILKQKEQSESPDIPANPKANSNAKKDSATVTPPELARRYFVDDDASPAEISDTALIASNDIAKNNDPTNEANRFPAQQTNDGYAGKIPEKKNATDENETINHYRKGINFIESNKYRQAANDFRWVIDNSDNEHFAARSRWYLALTYLMENNKVAAIPLLKKVSADTTATPFAEKAASLLYELRKE